jgi:hypothetical protein
MSAYSHKKPKNPLNKKYIEQLLDRRGPINPYDPQDEFTKKLIKNYDQFLPKPRAPPKRAYTVVGTEDMFPPP